VIKRFLVLFTIAILQMTAALVSGQLLLIVAALINFSVFILSGGLYTVMDIHIIRDNEFDIIIKVLNSIKYIDLMNMRIVYNNNEIRLVFSGDGIVKIEFIRIPFLGIILFSNVEEGRNYYEYIKNVVYDMMTG